MRRFACSLLLSLGLLVAAARAADAPTLHDPAGLLPSEAAAQIRAQLDELAKATGARVVVEFHPKSPSEQEDAVPGAYMRALAARLGTAQHGVLAVYFTDEPDWRLWVGDALTARFAGRVGSVAELTENNAIHDAKEALFARAKAEAAAAGQDAKSPARLAAETAALLRGLRARLGAK